MKCKNCGRKLSDDARFCEICGTPVDTEPTLAADQPTETDPHYDLSVFSDDGNTQQPAEQPTPAPAVEDDAAKTVLLPQNDTPPQPPRRSPAAHFPVDDDASKTTLLPNGNDQPAQRNRFEENLAMHRRYRAEETRSGYADRANHAPRRDENDRSPKPFRDAYRGYAPADQRAGGDRFHNERRPRYDDSFDGSDHYDDRRAGRGLRYDDDRDNNADRERRQRDDRRVGRNHEPPKKNKNKTALIISLIALILVIAILAGVIFFVNRNTVSASELKDAKEKYLPPSQAVTIDLTQKDPSSDDIQFKYDDRARITSCTYRANDKPYEQRYTYHDPERTVDIATTYREQPVHTESISYDNIKTPDKFEDVGGYIVRLDEESLTSGLPATEAMTIPPTEAPTEWALADAQPDEAMEQFLTTFVSCNGFNVGDYEYDYLNRQGTNPNILEKVCQQFSIVDWEVYSNGGRIEGWNRNNNNTGLTPADAPWADERIIDASMGVIANNCNTADWICTNIFNVDAADLPALYEQCYAEKKLWKANATNGLSYCALQYGKGLIGFKVNIREVKTDGRFSYVTYDRIDYNTNQVYESLYAVMEKKTIDGGTYWSLYSNTNQIPQTITPFTP